MKALLLIGLMVGLCAQVFAQTEASMCVSLSDQCCNTAWDSVEFSIPAGQQISKTYIHYNTPSGDQVKVECFGFPNGKTPVLIWDEEDLCGCGTKQTTEVHPIGGPNTIRFRVTCSGCTGDCAGGTARVQIYTAPKAVTCPENCSPN